MVDPIAVPDDANQNKPNRKTFFDDIKNHHNRLDRLERGSIRSGAVGGAGLRFYDPDSPTRATTSRVGEFDGYRWDLDEAKWTDVLGSRGFALYTGAESIDEDYPWFVATSDGVRQWVQVGYGAGVTETILLAAEYLYLRSEGGADLLFDEDGHAYLSSASATGNITIEPGTSGDLFLKNIDSVGAGDQLVFDSSSGAVKYVASALKYKQDVEDAEIDPEDVLKMRSRTWRDRNEVSQKPDTERRLIGFIADELADIPSLKQFVRFNEEGEPESIYYDRLIVALLELLKHQQAKIDEHDTQLQNINEKFDQLKNMVESIT